MQMGLPAVPSWVTLCSGDTLCWQRVPWDRGHGRDIKPTAWGLGRLCGVGNAPSTCPTSSVPSHEALSLGTLLTPTHRPPEATRSVPKGWHKAASQGSPSWFTCLRVERRDLSKPQEVTTCPLGDNPAVGCLGVGKSWVEVPRGSGGDLVTTWDCGASTVNCGVNLAGPSQRVTAVTSPGKPLRWPGAPGHVDHRAGNGDGKVTWPW